jgi:phosphodiesterase/alkaline phosphatase D-like protein
MTLNTMGRSAKSRMTAVLFALVMTIGSMAASPARAPASRLLRANQDRGPLPSAETAKALSVSSTAAVLSGRVDARNQPTHFKFQYGKTLPYSQTTATGEENVVGHRTELVAEAATGLRPGTTYHFRIIAFNKFGFTVGRDRTFRTLKPHN